MTSAIPYLEEPRAMNEAKTDGGPAFPSPACGDWSPEYGMSLRDFFAGHALDSGVCRTSVPEYDLTKYFGPTRTDISRTEIIAAEAYAIADAMLARRANSGSQP